jgi:hypothetical protein
MTQCWHPRAGRGQDYTLWEDSLLDALARVGLSRESIHEHSEHQAKQYGTAPRGERETTDEEPDISRLSRVARDKTPQVWQV